MQLPYSVSTEVLAAAIAHFVPAHVDVKSDGKGRSRGWGIARFKSAAEAQAAIDGLNGLDIGGRPATVRADTGPIGRQQ